jgi:hypothetical protein
MQTFLPNPTFYYSARNLDNVRLNKQIVECQQIINVLLDGGSWRNHPAVRMWENNVEALALYAEACMTIWLKRKRVWHRLNDWAGQHRSWDAIVERMRVVNTDWQRVQPELPAWLGDERLHSSHRGRLLLKGELDRARIRAKILLKGGVKPRLGIENLLMELFELPKSRANLRDLTVAQVTELHELMDEKGIEPYDNWYKQFRWSEEPSDDYFWPVQLLS